MSTENIIGDGASVGNIVQAGQVAGAISMGGDGITVRPAPSTEPPAMPDLRQLAEGVAAVAQAIEQGCSFPEGQLRSLRRACATLIEQVA